MFDRFNEHYLGEKLAPDFEVDVENLEFGTETIESMYDDVLVSPFVVEKVLDAERRGFAAVVISCFMDPGVQAGREVVRIPVIGPGEASMLFALLLGDTFSILDVGAERYRRYNPPRQVRELGFGSRFRSARGTGILVAEIGADPDKIAKPVISAAKQIQEEDEPDVIILGCTGLSTIADRVALALDVPVIDPSIAALRMGEALIRAGWVHSPRAYPVPSKKSRKMPQPYRLFKEDLVEHVKHSRV